MLIHLRIDRDIDGGWRVSLRERDARGVRGAVSPAGAARIHTAAAGDLSGGAVVLLPGRDSRQAAAEEGLGRVLLRELTRDEGLAREWSRLLGLSEGRDEAVWVAVDAEEQSIRALPWELLAASPEGAQIEAQAGAILRLAAGSPPRDRDAGARLRTLCWTLEPDDPNVQLIAARLDAACAEHDLAPPQAVGEVGGSAPAPAEGLAPTVLHLISHGEVLAEKLRLLGGTELAPGTAVHLLAPILRQVDLVVLHICEGGRDLPAELDGLSGRLLAAGARAVVASRSKLTVDAAAAFLEGLYAAAVGGAPLVAAAAAGRRSVRALASPYPDARWHQLRLVVGDLRTATAPLLSRQPAWRPAGWPVPGPDAAVHLAEARRLAVELGGGFLGIEHLALVLQQQPPTEGLEALRYPLALRAQEVRDGLGQLIRAPGRGEALALTPRLAALGAALPPRFSLNALWQLLLDRATVLLQLLTAGAHPVGDGQRRACDGEHLGEHHPALAGAPGRPGGDRRAGGRAAAPACPG